MCLNYLVLPIILYLYPFPLYYMEFLNFWKKSYHDIFLYILFLNYILYELLFEDLNHLDLNHFYFDVNILPFSFDLILQYFLLLILLLFLIHALEIFPRSLLIIRHATLDLGRATAGRC